MVEFLTGLERLPVAATLKNSVWLYPFVNTAHIVGVALLFGAIVPFDLRLLGLWRGNDPPAMARALVPVAAVGLLVAVCAGFLLFITRAGEYLASPYFVAKMAVLAAALVVAATGFALSRRAQLTAGQPAGPGLRVCAGASIVLWLGVITLGRLIGYF